jgi:DNA invertase Pin-like site-specific DNA recombinase
MTENKIQVSLKFPRNFVRNINLIKIEVRFGFHQISKSAKARVGPASRQIYNFRSCDPRLKPAYKTPYENGDRCFPGKTGAAQISVDLYAGNGMLQDMKAKLRIAVYGRVSTDGQNHSSQLRELREYVARRWPKAVVTKYLDTISGTRSSRVSLDALMSEIRKGRVDILAIYKLDRLGRSLQHLAQLIGEINNHGTALVVTSQGIDTTNENNSAGRLQLNVLMAVAEFERDNIVERINAGLAAARERGSKFGRPRTLDKHVAAVAELRAKGLSGRAIAAELGLPAGSVFALFKRGKEKARRVDSSRLA